MLERVPGRASGVGSWPGVDPVEPARTVFGELAGPHLPYLPELPARGPGADLVGRGATLLVDLPVDLQPSGWRLVDRPGRDLAQAQSYLRQDLDLLAEVADGYTGPLKVQATGPWTLAAQLRLVRLERAVVDPGACRDLVDSLAEGVARHVARVRELVPGAQVVVQLDEPSLPDVLLGGLATASGFGRLRAVEEPLVVEGLRTVLAAATGAGAVDTVVHCCAATAPVPVLARSGAGGIGIDVSLLGAPGWEAVAAAVESGLLLWAGAVPTQGPLPSDAAVADRVWTPWRRVGLPAERLDAVVLTPSCGLAGATFAAARAALDRSRSAAAVLAERSAGD
ncbi:MAG TPA: methionine synthase [Kineosporiaceae bacterium]|nr:methionine synthase [Kineosporiaceae bacterium]